MFPSLRTSLFKMVKTVIACNWVVSRVTEEDLKQYVQTGVLAKKEDIHLRVLGLGNPPGPKEGEVIVFTDHMIRGFTPARLKVLLRCATIFPTSSSRHRTQLGIQSMQLPGPL